MHTSLRLTSFQNFSVFPMNQPTRKENGDSKENQILVVKNISSCIIYVAYALFKQSPSEKRQHPLVN